MNKLFALNITVLLLFSCSPKEMSQTSAMRIEMSLTNESLLVDSLEFKFIQLETREECLIAEMSDVKIVDQRIFILDPYKTSSLFVFDMNGSFLAKVGRRGEGAMEYASSKNFDINTDLREIMINDVNRKRLLFYDLDTYEFKHAKSLSESYTEVALLTDNRMAYFYHGGIPKNNKNSHYIQVCDTLLNPIAEYYPAVFKSSASYSLMNRNIYRSENRNFVYHNQIPIVYEITANHFKPQYEFVFDSYNFPSIDYLNKEAGGNKDFVYTLLESGYISGYMVCETKDLLCVFFTRKLTDSYYGIHNKNTGQSYLYTANGFAKCFGVRIPLYLKGATDEYVIGQLSPSFMGKPYSPNAELQRILEGLSPEDNPVLCLFKWKENKG